MKIPKVESLIITIFFLCIAMWAISKCAGKRNQLVRAAGEFTEETDERPTPAAAESGAAPTEKKGLPQLQNAPPPTPEPAESTDATAATTPKTTPGGVPKLSNEKPATPPAASSAGPTYSKLFVTIDGLKVRKEPNLKSDVVTRLKLEEQVFFLNKKSEKTETINLGYETATDYWVNIRTKSGKEGWVFGAGVHYYRMKRKGVME